MPPVGGGDKCLSTYMLLLLKPEPRVSWCCMKHGDFHPAFPLDVEGSGDSAKFSFLHCPDCLTELR